MNRTFERYALFTSVCSSLAFACLAGCGSNGSSGLFGNGSVVPGVDAGAGGTMSSGGGGTSSTGGAGAAGFVGSGTGGGGGELAESGGAPPDLDSGAHDAGAIARDSGAGGTTNGAWARCSKDSDCTDGRVCTETAQSILVSGRSGACVHHCGLTAAGCDAPLEAGVVTCTQLLVASFCTISCGSSTPVCPAGMDCVGGVCYYSN